MLDYNVTTELIRNGFAIATTEARADAAAGLIQAYVYASSPADFKNKIACDKLADDLLVYGARVRDSWDGESFAAESHYTELVYARIVSQCVFNRTLERYNVKLPTVRVKNDYRSLIAGGQSTQEAYA